MNGAKTVVVIIAAVGAYLTFLGSMIYFAIRWSRRILNRKADALRSGLEAVGAKKVGEGQVGGLYVGTETEYEVNGKKVFASAYYASRSYVRVNLRVPGGPFPWVIVHPEGAIDKIGKAIGINREVQTGDKAFDDLAYVDTIDTDAVVSQLLASPQVRDGLRELLSLGYRAQFSAKGIEAFQVVYSLTAVDGSQSGKVAAVLGRIAEAVPGFAGQTLRPMVMGARVLLGFALMSPLFCGFGLAGATAMFSERMF